MAKKIIQYSETARRSLFSGIQKVSNAVKVTLGPRGRNVLLDKKFGAPAVNGGCLDQSPPFKKKRHPR